MAAEPSHTSSSSGDKKFREKDKEFQYGNYKRYYGYRTMPLGEDPRLWILKKEWIQGKDVLDIGCNIGHGEFELSSFVLS